MTFREHIKRNFRLAWPVMLGQFGHVMVGLADSIMLGRLSTDALAAGAFGNSIFIVPMVFGIGMAMGLTTPISNAAGEGNTSKAGGYLRHGLVVNHVTATVIFLLILVLYNFMDSLGQEAVVAEMSGSYLLIIGASIFPLMTFLTYKQFAEGLEDTKFAMMVSIGANLINIFFNYLLIYGNWGFPALGLNGAGIATLLARIIMAIVMYRHVMSGKKYRLYHAYIKKREWMKAYYRRLLEIGVPSGLQYIFEVSAFAIAAIFVGQISADALAAHQIAISLAALSYMMATGIGAAAAVRVGNQYGAKKYHIMRSAGRSCVTMGLLFMTLTGITFFFGRVYFPSFYTTDIYVIGIASQLLIVAVLFQVSDGTQAITLGALRGMGEVKIPTLITFVSYWLLGLGPAYYFGIYLDMGALGIWYGLALGLTFAAVFLYWRFEYKSKRLIDEHRSLA